MTWHMRKWAAKRWWSRVRYGIPAPPSLLPLVKAGKFVSLRRRGSTIDVTEHASGETIRVVPYQPNHGFMVELHRADGTMAWRTHLDFRALRALGFSDGERRGTTEAGNPPTPESDVPVQQGGGTEQ